MSVPNNKCPNCGDGIRPGSKSLTSCDGCKAEVHLACVGLDSEFLRVTRNKSKSLKIICNSCNKFMGELGDFKGLINALKEDFSKKFATLQQGIRETGETEITQLRSSIDNLQKDINRMRDDRRVDNPLGGSSAVEEVIFEIAEREKRKRNLLLFGVNEQRNDRAEDRVAADKSIVNDIISTADISLENVKYQLFRLGKFSPDKVRPIKVIFQSEDIVHSVIKRARDLKQLNRFDGISISLDRTPAQIGCYREVKKRLDERKRNGETNVRIKYVNGYPKIVSLNM